MRGSTTSSPRWRTWSSWRACRGCVETHRARVRDLVERFDLHAFASRRVGELSGGSRRRVDLAASLVGFTEGALPRRAHHRPGPGCPADGVGRGHRADRGRHHGRPDHPVPRGSRPARRPAGSSEQRPRRGPRRPQRAEATGRRQGRQGHRRTRPRRQPHPAPGHQLAQRRHPHDPRVLGRRRRSSRRPHRPARADTSGVTDLEVASPSLDDVFLHLTQTGAAA